MTIHSDGQTAVFDRFDSIEAILQRYPDIDEAELAELKHWFGKEASAMEIASLASKEHLRRQYGSFRAAHVDRFSAFEIVAAILVGTILLAVIGLVAMT